MQTRIETRGGGIEPTRLAPRQRRHVLERVMR